MGRYTQKGDRHTEEEKRKIGKGVKTYLANPLNRQKKAKQLKKITDYRKGKTWREIFGKEKAEKMIIACSSAHRKENGISRNFCNYLMFKYLNFDKICWICGSRRYVIIHHKDKNVRNNKIDNLLIICKSCHSKIHNNIKSIQKYNKR